MSKEEKKSLTHRLDLSGVALPQVQPVHQHSSPRAAQKQRRRGDKNSRRESTNSPQPVHEENVMSNTATESAIAAATASMLGDLSKFKGLDVKVRVQEKGVDWGKVGEVGMYAGIGIVTATAVTAATLGTARLLGYGPKSSE